jgi:hypothetical protein
VNVYYDFGINITSDYERNLLHKILNQIQLISSKGPRGANVYYNTLKKRVSWSRVLSEVVRFIYEI